MIITPYINFSDEQKRRANEVDLEDFLSRQGEELLRSGREMRLASDHSITIRGNCWYDHAEEKGGLAIDFLQMFYGMSFPEAVSILLGGEDGQGETYRPAQAKPIEPPKPFALPPAHSNMRRVFAYLCKARGIAPEIVSHFAHERILYESSERPKGTDREYRNAVFVGMDENGTAKHAHKRSLGSAGKAFRINVEGSDPRYSFHHLGESDRLYVFEAPIDLLSFITLYPENWREHSYAAMCGISSHAPLWMLEQYPHLQKVALCLDNDEAGRKGASRLKETFTAARPVTVIELLPTAKDWNDMLTGRTQQTMERGEDMCSYQTMTGL